MDNNTYHLLLECGCVHFFYRGTDFYAYTIVCARHRDIIGFKRGSTAVGLQTLTKLLYNGST